MAASKRLSFIALRYFDSLQSNCTIRDQGLGKLCYKTEEISNVNFCVRPLKEHNTCFHNICNILYIFNKVRYSILPFMLENRFLIPNFIKKSIFTAFGH